MVRRRTQQRLCSFGLVLLLMLSFVSSACLVVTMNQGRAEAIPAPAPPPVTGSPPAPTYANVSKSGWTFWIDGSEDDLKNNNFDKIIANKDEAGQAAYAVFTYDSAASGTRLFIQQPDYYFTSTVSVGDSQPCASNISVTKTAAEFSKKIPNPPSCGSNIRSTETDITIKPNIPVDILEKAQLENFGAKPLGCPLYDPLPPGSGAKNYNCPGNNGSVQNGIWVSGVIQPTAVSDPTDGLKQDETTPDCYASAGVFNWILCPVSTLVSGAIRALDTIINSLLSVDTDSIFSTTGSGAQTTTETADAYYKAWGSFRTIALGIVVITALIIVIASAFGLEFLDAYTMKKALPRVFVAVIGIALSWQLSRFFIDMSNDFGLAVRGLIYAPFSYLPDLTVAIGTQAIFVAFLAGGFVVYGVAFLLFLVTGLLAVLIAILTLVIREMIIVFCVIVAPVAIACYILPGTEKFWKLWSKTFIAVLIAFPIISGFIAIGRVFSVIAAQSSGPLMNLIGFIAYVLPYFLIPLAFKMAGGVMATISGIGNDKSRGVFDRLSKARQNAAKEKYQEHLTGKKRGWRDGFGVISGTYRRAHLRKQGGLSLTRAGRRNYQQASTQFLGRDVAKQVAEADKGEAGGNDPLMNILQDAKSYAEAVRRRAAQIHADGTDYDIAVRFAEEEVSAAVTSFKAQVGSRMMKIMAWKSEATSSTGYALRAGETDGDNLGRMINDGLALVEQGLISENDMIATIKSNKARPEFSDAAFSKIFDATRKARAAGRAGNTPPIVGRATAALLTEDAVTGMAPWELQNAKPETVERVAKIRLARLRRFERTQGTNSAAFRDELAAITGIYDSLGGMSQQKGRMFAEHLMTQTITVTNNKGGTEEMDVQQAVELTRRGVLPNQMFRHMRRDLETPAQGYVAGQGTPPATGGPPQPPGMPPGS